nr:MAG TPA: hypothetical protein [Caudoviricetes sp.]
MCCIFLPIKSHFLSNNKKEAVVSLTNRFFVAFLYIHHKSHNQL